MKIFIVIPCYNEEAVLPKTLEVLGNLIKTIKVKTDADTELLLVDDGSRDRTWQMISDAAKEHKYVHGIKLSHNRGHQNALWAGMEAAVDHCDAMVSIDADLQDDENVIIEMVQQVQEGKDIIYGVRKERKTDTFFKRFTAQAFYKLMQSVDKDTVYNHADFRMMTNRTLKALMQYSERNLFLGAIVRQLGFREGFVYYDRKAREAGESKVSAHQDAELQYRWHHLVFRGTIEVYHLPGSGDDPGGNRHDHLCLGGACPGQDHPGLDLPARLHVVYRWHHYHGCGHYGRLYRQDLYRGEAPPTILYRRKSINLKKENKFGRYKNSIGLMNPDAIFVSDYLFSAIICSVRCWHLSLQTDRSLPDGDILRVSLLPKPSVRYSPCRISP